MQEFTYAHNDTSTPERKSRTGTLNTLRVSDEILALREKAFAREIPVASDETLNFLLTLALSKNAKNILEVGSATGITARALLEALPNARITAIEREDKFFEEIKENLAPYLDRATLCHGDAAQEIAKLNEKYDFIFLDCAKVQYIKLLPVLKEKLCVSGILLADDVLLYGWVNGEYPVPKKRKMLVQHVKEYLDAINNDKELSSAVLDIGDGIAMSVKI